MALPMLNDPNVLDSNAVNYSLALQIAAGGHVLWHPSLVRRDGGVIGDCGYFDGGRFQVLYNVFDPPAALRIPALPTPSDHDVRVDEIPNHNDIIQSSQSYIVRVDANLQAPPLPTLLFLKIDTAASVAMNDRTIAFLAFCGPQRRMDWYPQTRIFEDYLVEHEDTILRHFRGYPMRSVVIVHATARVVSWWGGIDYSHSTSVQGHAEVCGTGVGMNITNADKRPWTFTRGPDQWDDSPEADRSIILRVVAVKRRFGTLRRSIRIALAGFTGNKPRPDQSPSSASSEKGSSSNSTAGSAHETTASSPASSLVEADESSSENQDGSGLLAEHEDLLDQALSEVLRANLDVDVAVGNWDVVASRSGIEVGFSPYPSRSHKLKVWSQEQPRGASWSFADALKVVVERETLDTKGVVGHLVDIMPKHPSLRKRVEEALDGDIVSRQWDSDRQVSARDIQDRKDNVISTVVSGSARRICSSKWESSSHTTNEARVGDSNCTTRPRAATLSNMRTLAVIMSAVVLHLSLPAVDDWSVPSRSRAFSVFSPAAVWPLCHLNDKGCEHTGPLPYQTLAPSHS
ncbi:hypothetical protein EXIGLDRAFT_749966, partial [Exidia glandulosa HHB12029]